MSATATSHAGTSRQSGLGAIGRFQLLRLLGKGNQSEVYLAHDPHLDREVAIKTLKFATAAEREANMDNLLAEARTVSRLHHPNIVTLYDAGEQDGQPYLVFEYVNGPTLAQVLKSEGPVAPSRAAELAVKILDAIACAHGQGIIHRDLKPSNILLDAKGVPRVMDFGVAGRIDSQNAKSGYLMGTPAYMAPEYITREEFGPQSDLFSFGMTLYELLTGKHAVRGKTIQDVMYHIVHDPIPGPSHVNAKIDEKFDDILLKVLRKEPDQRYADAGQLKNAFEMYLTPDAPDLPPAGADIKQSTLEFLLRRMRLKSDFPALSESVTSINRLTSSDKESVNKLSNSILKDFALTNKLLKLVNAAIYKHIGGGTVSTISRAVVILGFDQVRSISLSLMMFENMQNKGHAQQLKEEFVKALYAGMLARGMAAKAQVKDGEEAFICSMFHNLGQLLSKFYFPEESEEIEKLIATKDLGPGKAATQVLGLSFEELGIGIAKSWGFPDQLILSMKRLPEDEKVKKGNTNADKLRVLSGFSNELCEVILCTPENQRGKALAKLAKRFGDSLPISENQITQYMEKSLEDISQFASAVNVNLKQSSFAQRASKWAGMADTETKAAVAGKAEPTGAGAKDEMEDTRTALAATLLQEPQPMLDFDIVNEDGKPQRSTEEIQAMLASGLQDISNSLIDDKITVNDILRMILETMYSGIGFDHVLFCIKDGRRNTMNGKFGFGDGVQDMLKAFSFTMVEQPDVFHVALKNNADILISDINDQKIASRIPAWYRRDMTAHTFVLFPIVIKGKPIGLIYADRAKAGQITIPEKELSLLKSLRNQAVLAIRQSL